MNGDLGGEGRWGGVWGGGDPLAAFYNLQTLGPQLTLPPWEVVAHGLPTSGVHQGQRGL